MEATRSKGDRRELSETEGGGGEGRRRVVVGDVRNPGLLIEPSTSDGVE